MAVGAVAHLERLSLSPEVGHGFEAAILMRRQRILEVMARAARGGLGMAGPEWEARLLKVFVADTQGERPGAFLDAMLDIAEKLSRRDACTDVCHAVVDALRRQVIPSLRSDHSRRDRVEDLVHATHTAIHDVARQAAARQQMRLARWTREASAVSAALSATFDLAELQANLQPLLGSLSIDTFLVAVYPPEQDRAEVFAMADRGHQLGRRTPAAFARNLLLPGEWVESSDAGRSFVVMPLVRQGESLGHLLVELRLDHALGYGAIAEAISTALYGARLSGKRLD